MTLSLTAILATLCFLPDVTSFNCPDLTPCDCKRESHWSDNEVKVYNAVNCGGDFDIIQVNFSSLTDTFIKTFTLRNTSKTTLTSNTFVNLQVDTIRVENTIIEIDRRALMPLRDTLRHLALVNVKLNFSNLNFIEGFSALKTLILDRNGEFPYYFPAGAFSNLNLDSLRLLSLRHCGITDIPNTSFTKLLALEVLDLSHNFIPRIQDAVLTLTHLRKLFLSHNEKLDHIHHRAFLGLQELQELDLSHTGIHIILPYAFAGLEKSLQSLKLSNCKLPDGHFDILRELRMLRHLDISYNRIIEMHNTSFIGFDNLESLDISGQLEILDGFLYHVIFTDSMFRGIEDTLKILRMKDLGLNTLPLAALSSFKKLEILDVSNNDFGEGIDDGFFESVMANTILLKNCGINEIKSEAFETIDRGMTFNFDRNNVSNISFILETKHCLFRGLSFIDNPVSCDCDVVEIAVTQHVSDLKGACADTLYYGERLKDLHELAITRSMCDVSLFDKPKIDCSHVNRGTRLCFSHLSCSLSCLYALLFIISLFTS